MWSKRKTLWKSTTKKEREGLYIHSPSLPTTSLSRLSSKHTTTLIVHSIYYLLREWHKNHWNKWLFFSSYLVIMIIAINRVLLIIGIIFVITLFVGVHATDDSSPQTLLVSKIEKFILRFFTQVLLLLASRSRRNIVGFRTLYG